MFNYYTIILSFLIFNQILRQGYLVALRAFLMYYVNPSLCLGSFSFKNLPMMNVT